ncbi:sulfotransferase [Candidatus Omnitrophota bacterium]
MDKKHTLLFINGIYRSGTTFLSRLIDAFPDSYIHEDGFRFPYYYLLDQDRNMVYPRDMQKKEKLRLDRCPSDFPDFINNLRNEIERRPINGQLKEKLINFTGSLQKENTFLEIARSIFDLTQEHAGTRIVGTKTTYQHNYINDLLEFFPEAKWIEIIRDPRAIYASAKKSHAPDLKFICDVWNNAARAYVNVAGRHQPRFLLIKYEDLVLNPENTLSVIKRFLNLDIDLAAYLKDLSLSRNDDSSWFSNSSYKQNGVGWRDVGVKTAEYFDRQPVFRWQNNLNRLEQRIIAARCKENIERYGFPVKATENKFKIKDLRAVVLWFFKASTLKFIVKDILAKHAKVLS